MKYLKRVTDAHTAPLPARSRAGLARLVGWHSDVDLFIRDRLSWLCWRVVAEATSPAGFLHHAAHDGLEPAQDNQLGRGS